MPEQLFDPEEYVNDIEQRQADDPGVGDGNEDTAPDLQVAVGLFAAQPAAVIGALVSVIDAVIAAAIPMPEWLSAALIVAVTSAGVLGIRSKVTPVARPNITP